MYSTYLTRCPRLQQGRGPTVTVNPGPRSCGLRILRHTRPLGAIRMLVIRVNHLDGIGGCCMVHRAAPISAGRSRVCSFLLSHWILSGGDACRGSCLVDCYRYQLDFRFWYRFALVRSLNAKFQLGGSQPSYRGHNQKSSEKRSHNG